MAAHGDSARYLGFDFGTESVRVVIADRRGRLDGSAVAAFRHGQMVPGSAVAEKLFAQPLPTRFALQHPGDWLDAAARACREAMGGGTVDPQRIAGIGVDFTSCTMLPASADGTPLCLEPNRDEPRRSHSRLDRR